MLYQMEFYTEKLQDQNTVLNCEATNEREQYLFEHTMEEVDNATYCAEVFNKDKAIKFYNELDGKLKKYGLYDKTEKFKQDINSFTLNDFTLSYVDRNDPIYSVTYTNDKGSAYNINYQPNHKWYYGRYYDPDSDSDISLKDWIEYCQTGDYHLEHFDINKSSEVIPYLETINKQILQDFAEGYKRVSITLNKEDKLDEQRKYS